MSNNGPTSTSPPHTQYRQAIPVSAEIRNHCHIYLDEQLYISALTLLTDLVTSGASHPNNFETPAFAPVPFHIEIVSALLVHPRHTTQAPRSERVELASRALTFLRNLLATLGPLNANLGEAFSLSAPRTRGSRRGRNGGDDGSSESGDDDERMGGVVANKGRLRRCARDFWHIVGWAFNCSVAHPRRWRYWKVWLGYMLDVLDRDWEEREAMDWEGPPMAPEGAQRPDIECVNMRENALIVKYLSDCKGRSNAVKRVVGAVFAAGGVEDLRAYPEVFPNETREVQNGQKRKRTDSLKPEFGDFDDDDGDEITFDSSQTDGTLDSSQNAEEEVSTDPWLGFPDSIALRQRLLVQLSRVSATLPEHFIDFRELYEIYSANAKSLPPPAFSLLFAPSASSLLSTEILVSLSRLVLVRLSPSAAPRPHAISEQDADGITQEILERFILPCVASTSSAADNARVSILVESLFRLFLKSCGAGGTPELQAAVEKGVRAREAKARGDRRRKDRGGEDRDRMWLEASGERLRRLVEWVGSVEG